MDNEKEDRRKSEEHRQHLKSVGFKKGMQRHPKAGRQKIPEVVKDGLAKLVPSAMGGLEEILNDPNVKPAVKLAAIGMVISTFSSKAARQHVVRHEHSLADLVHEINSGGKTIDVTPVSEETEYLEYDDEDLDD